MKQINLLPWREHEKKSKIKKIFMIWFGVSCVCFSLLFIARITILQQVKNYQQISHSILLKLKTSAYKIHEIKKLQYEKKELIKMIKITRANHHQLGKILEFLMHFKYLVTPDLFIRFIEFCPPYFLLIMHASTEKKYFKIIKSMKVKFNYKLKTLIFNRSNDDSAIDFLVKVRI